MRAVIFRFARSGSKGVRGVVELAKFEKQLGESANALRSRNPIGFLNALYAHDGGKPIVGFKLFVNHYPPVQAYLILHCKPTSPSNRT